MFVLGGGRAPFETEESRAGMAKKVVSHMSMAVKASARLGICSRKDAFAKMFALISIRSTLFFPFVEL